MEDNEKQRLGSGIIAVAVIELIFSAMGIVGLIITMSMKDMIYQQLQAAGQSIAMPTTNQLIVSAVLSVFLIIAIILILMRKETGVYAYFTIEIISIVYSILINGFKYTVLLSLILPALMAVFIVKKKEVFGF